MENQEKVKHGKKFNYTYIIIGVCTLIICIGLGFCSSTKGVFFPYIIEYTGLPRGPYAISDSFRYITTAVVNLFFGTLVLKFGVKKLMAAGFVALVASMVLYGASSTLVGFYFAGILLGLGLAWTTTTMIGYIINKWVSKNRGTIMGVILASNGLGGAIAVNVFMPALESAPDGYKMVHFIIAGIVAVIGIIAVIFIKDKEAEENTTPSKKQKGDDWVGIDSKVAFKKAYFWLAMVGIFMTGVVIQGISGISIAHVKQTGVAPSLIAGITTFSMVCLTCTKFLTGFMYDKKGLRFTITINYACSFLSMITLVFVGPSTLGMGMYIANVILGNIALPLETIMLPIYAADLFGKKDYAKMLGLCVSVNTAGYALGAPVMGFVFDAFGSYMPAFLIGAVLIFLTAVTMEFVITSANKEKRRIEQELEKQEQLSA